MLARLAVVACALCLLHPAFASKTAPVRHGVNTCRMAVPTIRGLWQDDLYDVPPTVAAVMVNAIDGKLSQVRQGIAALPAIDQPRLRQIAMITAANTYQPVVVNGMLDDGATVNEPARLPPLKSIFYQQTVNTMIHDPHLGPHVVKALQSSGLMRNDGNIVGPALISAARCGDVATLNVLFRHHATVSARITPKGADALMVAVVQGNASIASALLDHGADVCADDRRITKPDTSLASIGEKEHLPPALIQRLTCHAPGASG